MTVLKTENPYYDTLLESTTIINDILKEKMGFYDTSTIFICCENEYFKYLNQNDPFLNTINKDIPHSLGLSLERVQSQTLNNNSVSNLIIVNTELYNNLKLSKEELCSVIAHELGHIFNKYKEKTPPSPINSNAEYDPTEYNRIRYENTLNKEIYADNFAVQLGFNNELKSGMLKYIQNFPNEKTDIFNSRLSLL